MTKSNDDQSSTESDPLKPSARRRFDPRVALLSSLGALVIVLAFALIMSLTSSKHNGASSKSVKVDTLQLGANDSTFTATTLPDAGLMTIDSQITDLRALTKGRPAMINMFSNSCTACRTEMPALEKLHREVGDRVRLIGVDLGDSPSVTKAFVAETGVTYTIVRDPSLLLVERLNITAQPMTIWVDAHGKITGHRYGALSPTEMRTALHDYLGIDTATG